MTTYGELQRAGLLNTELGLRKEYSVWFAPKMNMHTCACAYPRLDRSRNRHRSRCTHATDIHIQEVPA